jgi:nucleoside-diphosphate-sugar epimerase
VKALLTGGSGYIGSALHRHLKKAGWSVTLLCRPQTRLDDLEDSRFDYDGSYASIVEALSSSQPDVVFHLASLVLIDHSADQVQPLIESNITFPTLLLQAMHETGVRRMISAGTSWQHFSGEDDYLPANLYAATKQAFTDICTFYADAYDFDISELRLFDVYGPDDNRRKLLPLLVKLAKGEMEALGMTPGDQMLDMVHVDDTAEAFIATARATLANAQAGLKIYSVSTGHQVSLKELITTIEQLLGRPLPVTFGGRPYREREVMKAWAGGTRPPNWSASIDLASGLKAVFR